MDEQTLREILKRSEETIKQADKIIKAGKKVTVRDSLFHQTFTALFVRRDRWNIYCKHGGIFDRQALEVINKSNKG